MRTDSYRNTYAREGAPAQIPPSAAPVQQPQVFNYTAPPRTAPDTEFRQASPDTQVPYRVAGEQGNGNNRNDLDDVPLRNGPSPQAPGAETQPAGAVQDASGNFVFDRWDEAGTHTVDKFNKQTLTRSHEETDIDGTSSLLVFNERTGQRSSDVRTSDGSHRHNEWNERTGKHKEESWSPQGQYQCQEWDEATARAQALLRQYKNDVEQGLPNNRGNLDAPTSAAPGDVSQPPGSYPGNTGTGAPVGGGDQASPRPTNTDWRPVGDGRYGRGTGGQGGRGHVGPGGGGDGGGGGSVGPTGGAGNATAPQPAMINTGSSQFSQAQLNRLNAAPRNLMQFLDVALARLDKYGANDPELQQWFGKNANVDEIRQTLTRMRETLASGNYKFSLDPSTRDNWEMAHVFPNDKSHTIHVRPHMLDPVFGKNTPEVTLFHELSHYDDIGRTRDLVYGDWNAAMLAQRDSKAAMHNAENYGMFIRQVAQLA